MNFKTVKNIITKNSNLILTTLSIVGVGTSIYSAIQETPIYLDIIEQKRSEIDGEDLDKKDLFKCTIKSYPKTIISTGFTLLSIIMNATINEKKHAAIASVLLASESAYDRYKKIVDKKVSEDVKKDINEDYTKDTMHNNKILHGLQNVVVTGNGDTVVYDEYVGTFFYSDVEYIRKVQNNINESLMSDMSVSLNELYYDLGLPSVKMGEDLGFAINAGQLNIDFSSRLSDTGIPYVVIEYDVVCLKDYKALYM